MLHALYSTGRIERCDDGLVCEASDVLQSIGVTVPPPSVCTRAYDHIKEMISGSAASIKSALSTGRDHRPRRGGVKRNIRKPKPESSKGLPSSTFTKHKPGSSKGLLPSAFADVPCKQHFARFSGINSNWCYGKPLVQVIPLGRTFDGPSYCAFIMKESVLHEPVFGPIYSRPFHRSCGSEKNFLGVMIPSATLPATASHEYCIQIRFGLVVKTYDKDEPHAVGDIRTSYMEDDERSGMTGMGVIPDPHFTQ